MINAWAGECKEGKFRREHTHTHTNKQQQLWAVLAAAVSTDLCRIHFWHVTKTNHESASNSKCLWQKATTRPGCAAVHKLWRCIIHRSKAYSDMSCVCSYGWALPSRHMTRWMRLCGLNLLTLSMGWCSKDWHEKLRCALCVCVCSVQCYYTSRDRTDY